MIPTDGPTFLFECLGPTPIAGVDEVGRGPMAGPVVAAAVILRPSTIPPGLNDSKVLAPGVRKELCDALCRGSDVGVGAASVHEIDRINILQATFLAMQRAVSRLSQRPKLVLVDGTQMPKLSIPLRAVVKGDRRSLSIAAASIVAKVVRDRMMARLAERYPHYGWEHNVGYCTRTHREALERHGASVHHRRSFMPVRRVLGDVEGDVVRQVSLPL